YDHRKIIAPLLNTLYHCYSKTGYTPWRQTLSSLISLEKIKGTDDATKFRPISLLPCSFKILEKTLLNQIESKTPLRSLLSSLQGGSRRGRGVPETIGMLSSISNIADLNRKPLFSAFLDIKKAYDQVWQGAMFYKLKNRYKLHQKYIKMIHSFYHDSKAAIKYRYYIHHLFHPVHGVLQGSILSPLLYILFIDDLIEELQKLRVGAMTPLVDKLIAALLYCDDVSLLAHTPEDLQKLLNVCEKHSRTWGYRFNPNKCCVLSWNSNIKPYSDKQLQTEDKLKLHKEYIQMLINEDKFKKLRSLAPSTPIAIINISKNHKQYQVINSYGYTRWYTINKIANAHIEEYKDLMAISPQDIAPIMPLYWSTLPQNCHNTWYKMHQMQLYNVNVKFRYKTIYLGAELSAVEPHTMISTKLTNSRYIRRFYTKYQFDGIPLSSQLLIV
ncbi:MAG: reverse transcriptase family protein, partial [Candidatus Marinimicrobia bacterium]|nr:reverse transcriptase family protein [Candidatus Neomarinimicrobiota bacterium]